MSAVFFEEIKINFILVAFPGVEHSEEEGVPPLNFLSVVVKFSYHVEVASNQVRQHLHLSLLLLGELESTVYPAHPSHHLDDVLSMDNVLVDYQVREVSMLVQDFIDC